MDYHEAAAQWEQLCEGSELLRIYIENVEVREDRIVYNFDGHMKCVLFWNTEIGKWVERGDVRGDEDLVTIERGIIANTLIEVRDRLEEELRDPL
jgi:hypothetical protein